MSRVIQHALEYTNWHAGWVAHLRKKSTYYPSIYIEVANESKYFSTLVRVKDKKGVWWRIHCVESISIRSNNMHGVEQAMEGLMDKVYLVHNLHIPMPDHDVLDTDQREEKHKILEERPYLIGK